MNKQELIDKCVHERKGVLGKGNSDAQFIIVEDGEFYALTRQYMNSRSEISSDQIVCTVEEFQQRARELGYGVEAAEYESWYCYETQKALRLPPVGEVCQMYAAASWFDVKVIAEDDGKLIVKYLGCGNYYPAASVEKFYRPLDHSTRKAEAERNRVVDAALSEIDNSHFITKASLQALYDAGFLRMPEGK